MRRSTFGALATSLLVASVASAAVSSESEDADSRTTPIPGTGLAVTLPRDWRLWSTPPAGDAIVIGSHMRTRQSCEFGLVAGSRSAEGAAHETLETVAAHPAIEVLGSTFLTVPAGNAVRVSSRHASAPDEDRFVLHEYYITAPDGVASVTCSSDDPPADRWLSIVEAVAPLPADPPASAPFDPRVEVPDHGFAVDFGAEWLVRAWPAPGSVFGGANVLRALTVAGADGSGGYECVVEDDTGLASVPDVGSLDDWQEILISTAGAQKRRTSEPVVTQVSLPSGRTIRADWERWSEMPATAWVFLDSDRRAALLCRSDEPPDDRWLSIAETFEFLHAEE
jgi:hypothetical protein